MTKIKFERVCVWYDAGSKQYMGYCCNGENIPMYHGDEEGTYSAMYRSYVRPVSY